MADEQTPKSSDDAVDPSESSSFESHPLDAASQAEAERLAAQARSARPKRKRPASAVERGGAASADDAASPIDQAAGEAATAETQRASASRPVRRTPAGSASSEHPEESSRNPIVAAPRKREASPAAVERKRTTPAAFVGQSADELRKVIWPARQQLTAYFIVVLAFVLFIVAYVGALDVFFGWLLLKLFGK